MFKKYGKDAKLFKCKNENILFYVSKKECESKLYACKVLLVINQFVIFA